MDTVIRTAFLALRANTISWALDRAMAAKLEPAIIPPETPRRAIHLHPDTAYALSRRRGDATLGDYASGLLAAFAARPDGVELTSSQKKFHEEIVRSMSTPRGAAIGAYPQATYQKLKSGDWGVRVSAVVVPGAIVIVTTKSGQIRKEQIKRALWMSDGVTGASVITPKRIGVDGPPRDASDRSIGCDDYFTTSDLMARGWPIAAIKLLLPEPDIASGGKGEPNLYQAPKVIKLEEGFTLTLNEAKDRWSLVVNSTESGL